MSRQHEQRMYGYYNMGPYWGNGFYMGDILAIGLPFVLATGLMAQCVSALLRSAEVVQIVLLALGCQQARNTDPVKK